MSEWKGAVIRLTTEDATFEGTVFSIDLNERRATLKNVINKKTNKAIHGLQHYYGNELEHLEIIEEAKKESIVDTNMKNARGRLMRNERKPKHLRKLEDLNDDHLLASYAKKSASSDYEENCYESGVESGADDSYLSRTGGPLSYTVIDNFNDGSFQAMVNYLKNQTNIGFAVQGVNIGRFGELSLIMFSTKEKMIFFDILKLGTDALTSGIAQILEDQNIKKAIHNCRMLSDMFYHQYSVRLNNVFDTQVADVIVNKQITGLFPRFVKSYSECVMQYLPVRNQDICTPNIRAGIEQEDEKVWLQRPLNDFLLNVASKNVVYLCDLACVLDKRLLQEFTCGVSHFLHVCTDAKSEDLDQVYQNMHLLPSTFTKFCSPISTKRSPASRANNRQSSLPDKDDTYDGLHETSNGLSDRSIQFSKAGIWHKNIFDNDKSPGVKFAREQSKTVSPSQKSIDGLIEFPVPVGKSPKHIVKKKSHGNRSSDEDSSSFNVAQLAKLSSRQRPAGSETRTKQLTSPVITDVVTPNREIDEISMTHTHVQTNETNARQPNVVKISEKQVPPKHQYEHVCRPDTMTSARLSERYKFKDEKDDEWELDNMQSSVVDTSTEFDMIPCHSSHKKDDPNKKKEIENLASKIGSYSFEDVTTSPIHGVAGRGGKIVKAEQPQTPSIGHSFGTSMLGRGALFRKTVSPKDSDGSLSADGLRSPGGLVSSSPKIIGIGRGGVFLKQTPLQS
ncbi:uncharacterized protein LOC141905678 isoform X2 [Tubulanus polymorphus]|uniref:uncharacterized protein LOC141905678 isoform X2 n=1 Tax=Tubulanus polymorphus TaxID=672921 RepID=UPI003DA1E311